MYRVVLIDDEPLILAGISSLITWEDYQCTIAGKATNGGTGYQLICDVKPDIVITDIRMPVLNGLELVDKCQKAGLAFSFIVLTNLEEFQLVRQALSLGAVDYLVKLGLGSDALADALVKAKDACDILRRAGRLPDANGLDAAPEDPVKAYLERLLLFNWENAGPLPDLAPEKLPLSFTALMSLHFNYRPDGVPQKSYDLRRVSKQLLEITEGILRRFFPCYYLFEYSINSYLLAAAIDPRDEGHFKERASTAFQKVGSALKSCFELTAIFSIGGLKPSPDQLAFSLEEALGALDYYYYDSTVRVIFYDSQKTLPKQVRPFNINFLKKDLSASIIQNDSRRLQDLFRQIRELFMEYKPSRESAVSACINIYSYLYSFFETEDDDYSDIFPYSIDIAGQLSTLASLQDILCWMEGFEEKLCRLLDDRKEHRSDHLVTQAKRYIEDHYRDKLTLSSISEELKISPGYLSTCFKKITNTTLSTYIMEVKVRHAMELIDTHEYLMYEISDMLGFESPHYFSKVFKKVAGVSPREYETR